MRVLKTEKSVGIDIFFTKNVGIGGKLRTKPDDFIVKEISNYPKEKKGGNFSLADVTAVNWETNLLIRELSNVLNISRKRIGFAGTKDKRAKTTRLMSFYKVSMNKLEEINIKDVEVCNLYQSDRPIKIGDLKGNSFDIIIRNIDENICKENFRKNYEIIKNNDGFPNFFGIQRFGILRPISHLVGKYILKGDFEQAVMTYIGNPVDTEDIEDFLLRDKLERTHNFPEALKSYPNKLNFEKAILNKLVVDKNDFVKALLELPKNLLTMFIYAYQSYLFNKILSERIRRDLPLNKAIKGDIVLPIRSGKLTSESIYVTDDNIEKINRQILKGRAVVSGVLFGFDSIFSKGEMGEIEHKIIQEEKIDSRDFIIPEIPFISSSGLRRSLISKFNNLNYCWIDDNLNRNKFAINLKFELPKGNYATCLLREFMKADDIKKY
jgi:tRNA pseudouridine13 synthase